MIDISLPNVITIAIISVVAIAGVTWATRAAGVSLPGFGG